MSAVDTTQDFLRITIHNKNLQDEALWSANVAIEKPLTEQLLNGLKTTLHEMVDAYLDYLEENSSLDEDEFQANKDRIKSYNYEIDESQSPEDIQRAVWVLGDYLIEDYEFDCSFETLIKDASTVTTGNPNRKLTLNDVAGAKIIMARVDVNTQHPLYLTVDKGQIFERCSNSQNDITLWYFQDYDFKEYRELPEGTTDYVIILGEAK